MFQSSFPRYFIEFRAAATWLWQLLLDYHHISKKFLLILRKKKLREDIVLVKIKIHIYNLKLILLFERSSSYQHFERLYRRL